MDELPTIELLENTHEFPGPYMFKVIGRIDHAFAERVIAAVREELGFEQDPPFRLRQAAGGRHIAVTLEPIVKTAREVLAVYRRLKTLPGLVTLL